MSSRTHARLRRSVAPALVGALVPILFCVSQANGVVVTFSDRPTWTAAASLLGTINMEGFESLPTGTLPLGDNQLGQMTLKISPVGTTTTSGASINGTAPISGLRELNINADTAFRLYDVSFGAPMYALGFEFTGANTGGVAAMRIDGQLYVFGNQPSSGNGFFGFTSTTPIGSVEFEDSSPGTPSEVFESDNYSFVLVPEPAAIAGLVPALALLHRRKR